MTTNHYSLIKNLTHDFVNTGSIDNKSSLVQVMVQGGIGDTDVYLDRR